jgi:hypothetical protein
MRREIEMTMDARSYSHQLLEEIRIDAVRWIEAGESPEEGQVHCANQGRTQEERRARYA